MSSADRCRTERDDGMIDETRDRRQQGGAVGRLVGGKVQTAMTVRAQGGGIANGIRSTFPQGPDVVDFQERTAVVEEEGRGAAASLAHTFRRAKDIAAHVDSPAESRPSRRPQ